MSFDDTATVTVKRHDYRFNFQSMTKRQAIDKMKNTDLVEINRKL